MALKYSHLFFHPPDPPLLWGLDFINDAMIPPRWDFRWHDTLDSFSSSLLDEGASPLFRKARCRDRSCIHLANISLLEWGNGWNCQRVDLFTWDKNDCCRTWFWNTLEIPWASSIGDYKTRCPSNMLYWEAISVAIRNGLNRLPFGRSTPNEGTYNFKNNGVHSLCNSTGNTWWMVVTWYVIWAHRI